MNIFTKKLLIIPFVISLLILLIPVQSYASSNFVSGDSVILPKNDTINSDYYAAGGTNIVNGTVNGDAYVAGGNVIINGTVFGDVLAAGGNLNINGRVTGNVRAVGGQVVVTGEIDRNVTVAGGTVVIQQPAIINGSFTAASGNLTLSAPIGKGAVLAGGQVSIDGSIGGDVNAAAEQVSVLQDAKINGGLTYWSPNQAHVVQFTIRDGTTYHHTDWKTQRTTPPTSPQKTAGALFGLSIMWITINIAISFLFGAILLHVAPIFMENITNRIITKPIPSLGIGFVTLVLVPFTFVVLLITVIGIPFAFLLVFAMLLFCLFNQIFIGFAIGKKLLPKRHELALLTGLIIFAIVSGIPFIGWMFNAVAIAIGLGAAIVVKKELYTSLRIKKLI